MAEFGVLGLRRRVPERTTRDGTVAKLLRHRWVVLEPRKSEGVKEGRAGQRPSKAGLDVLNKERHSLDTIGRDQNLRPDVKVRDSYEGRLPRAVLENEDPRGSASGPVVALDDGVRSVEEPYLPFDATHAPRMLANQ